jgi:TetR/AcrR family transcriptional regulator, tetracycline repressor protein
MPLQRETVARAALHLLDEVGLDGLTMRRLAADLDIQNPSLYWHFTNKQELLNCIAELMIADAFAELQPPEPEQDWADWLATFARQLYRTMLAHRDGARVLAEADMSLDTFFVGIELALDVLQQTGFDPHIAIAGVITVIHYVLGHSFEAQADPSSRAYGEDEKRLRALKLSVDGERFPRIAAFLHSTEILSPASADVWFEEGLSLILDGLRAHLAKERPNGMGR